MVNPPFHALRRAGPPFRRGADPAPSPSRPAGTRNPRLPEKGSGKTNRSHHPPPGGAAGPKIPRPRPPRHRAGRRSPGERSSPAAWRPFALPAPGALEGEEEERVVIAGEEGTIDAAHPVPHRAHDNPPSSASSSRSFLPSTPCAAFPSTADKPGGTSRAGRQPGKVEAWISCRCESGKANPLGLQPPRSGPRRPPQRGRRRPHRLSAPDGEGEGTAWPDVRPEVISRSGRAKCP